MKSEVVAAWTRQSSQVWKTLQETGRYTVDECYVKAKNGAIGDYYLSLYRWYTQMCRRYIEIPDSLTCPIWLALAQSSRLPPADKTVSLTLQIPREKLFIIDEAKWGYRVNQWYIPADQQDAAQYEQELRKSGIYNEALLFVSDRGNFYPALRQKIVRSWDRLFDGASEDMGQNIGTVWELSLDWVKEVVFYGI